MPTIAQLKKHSLYKQINGRSKMKKAELIAALISLGGVIGSSPKKSRKTKRRVSRKRRSVKRKASRKRRSVKRKGSRKRRSVKRKVSRKLRTCKYGRNPVTGKCNKRPRVKKKASRKRRSVKRNASRKRRSVKRKVSRKRRSVRRKRRSVKRKVSRNKRSMKRKASSRTSEKKVSRSVKRKITKPSLKVTQPMEMIYQMTPVVDIPDPLLVKFRLSPQIVHGYDLILLRNMMEAGMDTDPYTNLKFSNAHIKQAKDKWDALRRTSDPKILEYLVEEEVIKDITSSIPTGMKKRRPLHMNYK